MDNKRFISIKNIYKKATSDIKYGYHVTNKNFLKDIFKNGLTINNEKNFTIAGDWVVNEIGVIPIYFSRSIDNNRYIKNDVPILKVDVSSYNIFPDLPTLIDYGAIYEEGGILYFSEEHEMKMPSSVVRHLDDGAIYISDFFENKEISYDFINLTNTFCVLENIDPKNIMLIN